MSTWESFIYPLTALLGWVLTNLEAVSLSFTVKSSRVSATGATLSSRNANGESLFEPLPEQTIAFV